MDRDMLEVGDVFHTGPNSSIWFVDQVGGSELCRGRCVRQGKSQTRTFGEHSAVGRLILERTHVIAKAVDFEHACAIVALII